jgi:hypothetical protein
MSDGHEQRRAHRSGRLPWERPHLLSVSIPVVEELLAESYKKKAEQWGEAAKRLREDPSLTAVLTTGARP